MLYVRPRIFYGHREQGEAGSAGHARRHVRSSHVEEGEGGAHTRYVIMCCVDMRPFSMAFQPGFRYFVGGFSPAYVQSTIHHETMERILDRIGGGRTRRHLGEAPGAACFCGRTRVLWARVRRAVRHDEYEWRRVLLSRRFVRPEGFHGDGEADANYEGFPGHAHSARRGTLDPPGQCQHPPICFCSLLFKDKWCGCEVVLTYFLAGVVPLALFCFSFCFCSSMYF